MFHKIPPEMRQRMQELEQIDAQDRRDGTARLDRLRQIPPETGRFVALMAASAPEGRYVEIGASAAYSTMWIALACRRLGRRLTSFEILEKKVVLARETLSRTRLDDVVDLVHGDALDYLGTMEGIAFCFLDAEKEIYEAAYDFVMERLVSGGILLADNAINHAATLQPMLDKALADSRADAMIVPVGKGVLLARKA